MRAYGVTTAARRQPLAETCARASCTGAIGVDIAA
jgi:hypothetical protein